MPLYEIRYKNGKVGDKKRVIEEANIQRAFLTAHKDLPDDEDIEAVKEIATQKEEIRHKITAAFFNIMNYGIAGVDLVDCWGELNNENLWTLHALLTSIKEWTDKAETYLLAYERLIY
jgi:hypothetical protein